MGFIAAPPVNFQIMHDLSMTYVFHIGRQIAFLGLTTVICYQPI